MANERDIWERQESDTDKSYQAFCVYRDMGRDRTIEKVSQECTKSVPIIKRWSSKHGWVARASAYDDYLDELQRQAYEENLIAGRTAHVQGIIARCEQMLTRWDDAYKTAQMLSRKRVIELDGKTIEIMELSLNDQHGFTKWLSDIDGLIRKQYEMPDRYTQQKIETDVPRDKSWEQAIANLANGGNDEW